MRSQIVTSRRFRIQLAVTFCDLKISSKENWLARKLDALEKKYDKQFKAVFDAIRQLMAPAVTSKRRLGFRTKEDK